MSALFLLIRIDSAFASSTSQNSTLVVGSSTDCKAAMYFLLALVILVWADSIMFLSASELSARNFFFSSSTVRASSTACALAVDGLTFSVVTSKVSVLTCTSALLALTTSFTVSATDVTVVFIFFVV